MSALQPAPLFPADLTAGAPTRRPTVGGLAAFAGHSDCNLAVLGFAAGVDFDRLLAGTRLAAPFGQSPFAFSRGLTFEQSLRQDGYRALLELLQLGGPDARVTNLRVGYPSNRQGMALRARQTRALFADMVAGRAGAPNLLDGAVFATTVGGTPAHFEADAVAARTRGLIQIGEVKSFPVVDGRADPEKTGAALDQAAVYVLLARQLVGELGADPGVVSGSAILITPRNVGLQPTISVQNVDRRVARVERLLARAPSAAEVMARVPRGARFGAVADATGDEAQRLRGLEALAGAVGTAYGPPCLATCGLARFCRERASRAGSPRLVGSQALRLLPGVESLQRTAALAGGAHAEPAETPAAAQLVRAARLYERLGVGAPLTVGASK